MASRSGSEEREPRRQQTQPYDSEGEESEGSHRQPRRGQAQPNDLALGNANNRAGNPPSTRPGALGRPVNQAPEKKGGGKGDTLRLRLDLDLDVDITLKARIYGNVELALLLE